jgi:hypothetical protein
MIIDLLFEFLTKISILKFVTFLKFVTLPWVKNDTFPCDW